jgi:hypothetical protein
LSKGGVSVVTVRWNRYDWGATAFLLLVVLFFHWPLITPDLVRRQAYPEADFYDQFHAFASYEHDRLWAGSVPLWNPYVFGGHPFLADVQAAVFYPPSLLTIALNGPGPFSPLWLELEAIAHLYLAALFTYLFVRRLTVSLLGGPHRVACDALSRAGALISALAFALGGYLTGYPPLQLAILETQVWLPLVLLLLDMGLCGRRWRSILGAGAAWGMALLAGHPQSAMYVFYASLLYGLYRSWRAKLSWRWAIVAHLTWIVIGLGLAAVHLVPAWEFMRLSVRASLTYQELAGGFGVRDFLQYFVPGTISRWSPVYVGILPLFLAVMACVGWRKYCEWVDVLFWAMLALIGLVLSLGGKTFLYRLFYWIVPGFNLFRSQERAIYLTSFCLSVLAGCGWIWLSRWPHWLMGSVSVLSLVVTVIVWAIGRERSDFELDVWLKRLLLWVAWNWAGWGLVWWMPWFVGQKKGAWAAILALALVVVDLSAANATTNLSPGLAESRVYDGEWLVSAVDADRLFRIANEWGLPGNGGCWLRLQDLWGGSPLRLQAHKVMADALPRWRLWQLFGVRYVATWEHDLPGPFPARRIAMRGGEWEKNTVYVHRLDADFSRAWVVYRAQQVDDESVLTMLAVPDFDPFEQVLLADPVPAGFALMSPATSSLASPDRPAVVDVVAYAPEEMVIQVDLSARGWLVLGEWHYPGWGAWVDGERQKIYRADYGLRAVPLTAGSHRVVFRYRPTSFYLGVMISALASLVLLSGLFVCFGRRDTGRSLAGSG